MGSEPRDKPTLAVIGGHYSYELLSKSRDAERVGRIDTPFGASEPIFILKRADAPLYFLSRHGETGYNTAPALVNYRANIYALKDLEVERIIAWSGPAAISLKYIVGQYVIVDDLIDETKKREGTFFRFGGLGSIRQNAVFCPTLRNVLRGALLDLGLDFADQGTYVCTEGPRLDTAAEVRKYASYGGDLLGQSLAPEVFLARELEMCYAALCHVVHHAEGVQGRKSAPGELMGGLMNRTEKQRVREGAAFIPRILSRVVQRIAQAKTVCACRDAMLFYKKRKRISDNWREWLNP